MPITPYILTGHTRDITHITFNRDGDLLFTCSKDQTCQLWFTQQGKRVGSYDHNGAVSCCEPTTDSKYLVTASADSQAQVFNVETGKLLQRYSHKNPVRHCTWAIGNQMFAVVENGSKKQSSRIVLWPWDPESSDASKPLDETDDALRTIIVDSADALLGDFRKCSFLDTDGTILAIHGTNTTGIVSLWNSDTEECINHVQLSDRELTDIFLSPDRGLALITSKNHKAFLIDTTSLEVIKTYESDRPLNCGVISPILNHTLLAGGQDKHEVTLSGTTEGHFEVDFWHTIYSERLESVVGHYGPVNTLAITRDGKVFASGSEDGNIRLYHFDDGYFKCTY